MFGGEIWRKISTTNTISTNSAAAEFLLSKEMEETAKHKLKEVVLFYFTSILFLS